MLSISYRGTTVKVWKDGQIIWWKDCYTYERTVEAMREIKGVLYENQCPMAGEANCEGKVHVAIHRAA